MIFHGKWAQRSTIVSSLEPGSIPKPTTSRGYESKPNLLRERSWWFRRKNWVPSFLSENFSAKLMELPIEAPCVSRILSIMKVPYERDAQWIFIPWKATKVRVMSRQRASARMEPSHREDTKRNRILTKIWSPKPMKLPIEVERILGLERTCLPSRHGTYPRPTPRPPFPWVAHLFEEQVLGGNRTAVRSRSEAKWRIKNARLPHFPHSSLLS